MKSFQNWPASCSAAAGADRSTRSSSKPSGSSLPFQDASAANTTRCPRRRSTSPIPMQLLVGPYALSGMNRMVSGLPAMAAPSRARITRLPKVAEPAGGPGPVHLAELGRGPVRRRPPPCWPARAASPGPVSGPPAWLSAGCPAGPARFRGPSRLGAGRFARPGGASRPGAAGWPVPGNPAGGVPDPAARSARGFPAGRASSGSAPRPAGCSTRASTRLDMKRAVRTTAPPLVTSITSTTPRPVTTSTRRPARVAVTSYVRDVPPASMTISTRSPLMAWPTGHACHLRTR